MKSFQWKQRGLAAILAASLIGLPQVAAAGDRHDGYDHNSGAYASPYRGNNGYAYSQPRADYRDRGYYTGSNRDRYSDDRYYGPGYGGYYEQSPGKSAAIIGGSAAAGAVFGALAGGGKGAAIGAVVGGLGGLIVNQATRDHHRY